MPCDVQVLPCLGITMYRSVRERDIDKGGREGEGEGDREGGICRG
jgi:hypothetical protein